MLAWLLVIGSVSLARPVDLTLEVPTGTVLELDERFSMSKDDRAESVTVTGRVTCLEGGRLGQAPLRWRFALRSDETGPEPVVLEASFRADGGPAEDWSELFPRPYDHRMMSTLFTDQFRLLPTGRHRRGETWTDTVESAFFGGPLELTWTLQDLTRTDVTLSVTGVGQVGNEALNDVRGPYEVSGTMIVDRDTRFPTQSDATWTVPTDDGTVRVRVERGLTVGQAMAPEPTEAPSKVATPVASAESAERAMAALADALPTRENPFPDREVAVAAFRAARAASGADFPGHLRRILGTYPERHYWLAAYATSESYLGGDAPDWALALTLAEAALALVPLETDVNERVHLETKLRFNAARYAARLSLNGVASAHKSRFEALLATGASPALGSVPAVTQEEGERFDAIPTVPVPEAILPPGVAF